jgi:hypothetical protein
MKKFLTLFLLITGLSLTQALTALATQIPFTGDVAVDFAPYYTFEVLDIVGDVGLPPAAPDGTVSGWEIERVVFYLSFEDNMLQVGLENAGIAGDPDGNGIDGDTPVWLQELGGVDTPMLNSSESMGIAFDFDMDGNYDLVTGVSSMGDEHQVCVFSGMPAMPFMAFGADLPQHNGGRFYDPVPSSPDYELTLTNIFDLLVWDGDQVCFDFLAFGGSWEDDGIGEEFVSATMCLDEPVPTHVSIPTGITLSTFPNPFNPSSNVHFTLTEAGPVTLQVYNLTCDLVSTLVDGDLPVGEHQVVFDGSNLPSGIYIAQITTANATSAARMVLLK